MEGARGDEYGEHVVRAAKRTLGGYRLKLGMRAVPELIVGDDGAGKSLIVVHGIDRFRHDEGIVLDLEGVEAVHTALGRLLAGEL